MPTPQAILAAQSAERRQAFPLHFRDTVIPRLREEAARQGALVALEEAEFEDAASAVRWIATASGAGLLTVEQREQIYDRIPDLIWDAYLAATREIEVDQRQREADPVAHYEALAASCRDPEQMRWTFAAICPEYRAYLLAARRAG